MGEGRRKTPGTPRKLQMIAVVLLSLLGAASAYQNVYGGELQKRSESGMALTGFTRIGKCVDRNDDAGSHHVCIDMRSNTGGNFCQVTRQPDWCSSSMRCDGSYGECPVEHWCVCQWAFASYLKGAGGCDKIQKVVCEATNMVALTHYRQQAPYNPDVANALQCLEQKCGLQETHA